MCIGRNKDMLLVFGGLNAGNEVLAAPALLKLGQCPQSPRTVHLNVHFLFYDRSIPADNIVCLLIYALLFYRSIC